MFSEIFRQLLQENHTTALQTAKDLHIPKSIVYEWKNGQREPSAENMKKIAAYFHVSFARLLGIPETDFQSDSESSEQELFLMLRAAREISPEDHNELVENMKRSINLYLRAKRNTLLDSTPLDSTSADSASESAAREIRKPEQGTAYSTQYMDHDAENNSHCIQNCSREGNEPHDRK